LAQRIAHTDPAKYRPAKAVHGGAGQMDFMALLDAHSLDTNLFFLHRELAITFTINARRCLSSLTARRSLPLMAGRPY
jgi:hypothetical protein